MTPIWICLFTNPTRASSSCLDLSRSLPPPPPPSLPPSPNPFVSTYIQLPHTDTFLQILQEGLGKQEVFLPMRLMFLFLYDQYF